MANFTITISGSFVSGTAARDGFYMNAGQCTVLGSRASTRARWWPTISNSSERGLPGVGAMNDVPSVEIEPAVRPLARSGFASCGGSLACYHF
jgi:hypothetical protein